MDHVVLFLVHGSEGLLDFAKADLLCEVEQWDHQHGGCPILLQDRDELVLEFVRKEGEDRFQHGLPNVGIWWSKAVHRGQAQEQPPRWVVAQLLSWWWNNVC